MQNTLAEIRGKDLYEIKYELARTATWATYLAIARHTGQRFMLKMMAQADYSLDSWLQREAAALTHVFSPRVVRLHDMGLTEQGFFFLILEDVQGRLLSDWAKEQGKLDEFTAMRFLRHLASALKDTHELGIVHQGIDDTAIFICPSSNAEDEVLLKLWDFGLARARRSGWFSESPTGFKRLGFLAPEQVDGSKIDIRTDIYGIGAVVYWLLTGIAPYEAESLAQLFKKISRADISPPPLATVRPDLSADAIEVIERCLAKQPAERFLSPDELLKQIHVPNQLEYEYVRAERAERRKAWSEVLQIAKDAHDLPGAKVRFRDLERRATQMFDEEIVRNATDLQQKARELLQLGDLQAAESEIRQLDQTLAQYPILDERMGLRLSISNFRAELQQQRRFKPAYLEAISTDEHPATPQPQIYKLLKTQLRLGRRGQKEQGPPQLFDLIDLGLEAASKTISRTQAWLFFKDGFWLIKPNHEARNPSYLNESLIKEESRLKDQDVLRLGKVMLRFCLTAES